MSLLEIITEKSPAKRRDGSGDIIPGKYTTKRILVCICDHCGSRTNKKYKKGDLKKYTDNLSYCSRECADNAVRVGGATWKKSRDTCMERYGVDNIAKLPETWVKIRDTCSERYGHFNYLGSDKCRADTKAFLESQGVSNLFEIPEVREKYSNSIMARFGVLNPSQSPELKISKENTCLRNWGFKYYTQHPECRRRFSELAKTKEFQARRHASLLRNGVFKRQSSIGEDRLYSSLSRIFPNTVRHRFINLWDIDLFVPEIELYLNFNGVYWHGRYLTEDVLLDSTSLQSKVILGTKYRDEAREKWFRENQLFFRVVWEDELECFLHFLETVPVMFAITGDRDLRGVLDSWFKSDPSYRKRKILGLPEADINSDEEVGVSDVESAE